MLATFPISRSRLQGSERQLIVTSRTGEPVIMADNFNYIAFGDMGYVADADGPIAMSRGRMFEYTPTDIEKRLEGLDPTAIAFLEQLPTFLCSELAQLDGAARMVVRFGRIEQTMSGRREVNTTFRPLVEFGEIDFENRAAAQALFDLDAFQLHRTHWAVREGDVEQILDRLYALKPVARNDGAVRVPAIGDPGAEPPPRNKNLLGEARSVEGFLKILSKSDIGETVETFFRGHEDAQFELTPSLLRKWPDGSWQFMPKEDRLNKELLIAHYDDFAGDQYCFDRLVRMQHYGLPTRLLDISGNPLVALFFACDGSDDSKRKTGEVIVFQVSSDRLKYYDSDSVSCLSNLSNLTYDQKSDIDLSLSEKSFNETDVAKKLLHHIKSEKAYFEAKIVPDDLGSIICVKAKRTNTRIRSQSGAFLLFGHEATLPETGQEDIAIARITIRNKAHILAQLNRLNINATTVYPSIEQTAVHLRRQYKLPQLS
ncbi:FRG domain-containing protein [Caulobacter sp. ErkDOM-E]|uniref:FRG domain-containing protein n=1 Tax=Caulobacter sp. ErkDOM-E TaxID=3402778 RepID=UPI003AF8FF4F